MSWTTLIGASFDNWLDAVDASFCTFEGGDDPTQVCNIIVTVVGAFHIVWQFRMESTLIRCREDSKARFHFGKFDSTSYYLTQAPSPAALWLHRTQSPFPFYRMSRLWLPPLPTGNVQNTQRCVFNCHNAMRIFCWPWLHYQAWHDGDHGFPQQWWQWCSRKRRRMPEFNTYASFSLILELSVTVIDIF